MSRQVKTLTQCPVKRRCLVPTLRRLDCFHLLLLSLLYATAALLGLQYCSSSLNGAPIASHRTLQSARNISSSVEQISHLQLCLCQSSSLSCDRYVTSPVMTVYERNRSLSEHCGPGESLASVCSHFGLLQKSCCHSIRVIENSKVLPDTIVRR